MSKLRTRVYRVVTETPQGWQWTCAWCFATAKDPAPSWDAAVDALMDQHAPTCKPYQRWLALYTVLERKQARRRTRARNARAVVHHGAETLPLF